MQELKMNAIMWAGWIYCHTNYKPGEERQYKEAMDTMITAMNRQTKRKPSVEADGEKVMYICPECRGFLVSSVMGKHYMKGLTHCPACGQLITWE